MSTSACASRPPCRPLPAHRSVCCIATLPPPMLSTQPACQPLFVQVGWRVDKWLHISVCRLASLLHLCLRLSQRVDHCLRKSASMSTSGCASLTVSPTAFSSTYAFHSASASTSASASRPACRPVSVHRSLCRLVFLSKPWLESQEACRPALAQVSHRVDHCLRIAHCVAYRLYIHLYF